LKRKNSAIEADAVQFMSEFAAYLIAAGVGTKRFERIVRLGYFLAASRAARFGNKRLNQSAVAAMTGLTRVQVRRFAKQPAIVQAPIPDRVDQLVQGWITDSAFTTSKSLPRKLRLSGGGRGFAALVRRYGGDVPSRALLRELQRRGLVVVKGNYASLRPEAGLSQSEYRLQVLSRSLRQLIEGGGFAETRSPLRTIDLEVSYPAPGRAGRLQLHKRAEEAAKNFLEGLREMGFVAAMSSPSLRRRTGGTVRMRLALITDEVGQ
jgi:hypothetical protein